jgi:hypothetical protein
MLGKMLGSISPCKCNSALICARSLHMRRHALVSSREHIQMFELASQNAPQNSSSIKKNVSDFDNVYGFVETLLKRMGNFELGGAPKIEPRKRTPSMEIVPVLTA